MWAMKTDCKHFGEINKLNVIQSKIFLILPTICLFLPMKFEAKIEIYMKPPKYELLGTAWTVWLEGKIEAGDAERLKKAIIENEIPVY